MVARLPIALFCLAAATAFPVPGQASDAPLSLTRALQRALAANPRLTAAERDIGIASGRRIQAGALPNPDASFEVDNVAGSGTYRGTRSAETTLQLGQLVELPGKRAARMAIGDAEIDSARWQREALRLEILSETATAFFNILGAQRRVQIFNTQIAALDRLTPLLQRRVDAGAASIAETARSQVAVDLVKAERERARTALAIHRRELASLMGRDAPDFGQALGDLVLNSSLPPFRTILATLSNNPQLIRWTAVRAQRDAELIAARLKPYPDVRLTAGWRHYRDTNDNAVRLGVSIPLPVFDQNRGGVIEAHEARAKVDAEQMAARAALTLTLGRTYETMVGSANEVKLLRGSAIENSRRALEAIESGYAQGRFTLLELLDAQATATQASLREMEALINYHTSIAVLEGLTGVPLGLGRRERGR
ncbi:divalent cation transporter [Afipia sp. P52-10]|uniref:TolC family protein n=1 Tax=Afipia sp. P52-10 TaxID=1429916 RepID=UPI0003DF2BD9|nr:TolC family protein [Afipia sp. P52-10]ETR76209.1 divalent cation transporter [Afipia sp. P52-10]